ncbi:cytoplasmic protein [Nitratireductor arenosus]|uniref:cytoplasmic protein n=1 Tax=Nitratireductor arenosus TaxID=2682096 RepID=UPI001FE93B06|nr:cytoplasmic protein [Nitratireductor arenosus]
MIDEAQAFGGKKAEQARVAANRVALFAVCGIDLETAVDAPVARKRLVRLRLKRLIERERLKGEARHWSYDLNRHIALKQVYDLLGANTPSRAGKTKTAPEGAAR